ncbi:unnamed protein product [Rotaria socialis]|nr:unnamed protein product [Rotaria socialis]CAF3319732.1 unnamed protein product [Rotaria socialis]CAF3420217.1 unnamed protein product [Rotaria socialis]CAF4117757.1 unnamed protein product [Rotaria socialis]CAF4320303.1 unnamed protein product [Rotaria socialis]
MYSKLLKEILVEIEHDNHAKTKLGDFCYDQYGDNSQELKIIDEFKRKYSPSSAKWWYTRECFTNTMLNKALRTQDIEIITRVGFFIRDLDQQIQELHAKIKYQGVLTVYRGQGMLNSELEK